MASMCFLVGLVTFSDMHCTILPFFLWYHQGLATTNRIRPIVLSLGSSGKVKSRRSLYVEVPIRLRSVATRIFSSLVLLAVKYWSNFSQYTVQSSPFGSNSDTFPINTEAIMFWNHRYIRHHVQQPNLLDILFLGFFLVTSSPFVVFL